MQSDFLKYEASSSQFRHPLFYITVLMTVGFFSSQFWPETPIFDNVEAFLPYHSMLEMFSVTVSLMVFAIVWNSFNNDRSINLIFIAVTFLAVGVIDFFHSFSYFGMPDFFGENSTQKALIFWISARLIAAIMFLMVALMPWFNNSYENNKYLVLIGGVFVTGGVLLSGIHYPQWYPVFFVDGYGLTDFKIIIEYFIVVLHFATVALLLTKKDAVGVNFIWFACAVWLMALAELFFTLYSSVSDLYNLAGHVYKAVAYIMVFKALFLASITRPYKELEQRSVEKLLLTQYAVDNSGDLIYWLDYDGRILSVNDAVKQKLGVQADDMINSHIGRFESALVPDSWKQLREQFSEHHQLVLDGVHLCRNSEKFFSQVRIVFFKYRSQNYICLFIADITERKLALESLARKQEQLAQAQRITHIGSWEFNLESKETVWSEEVYHILQADEKVVKASFNNFLQYVHSDDRQRVIDHYQRCLTDYSPYHLVHRLQLLDGSSRYVETRAEMQRINGEPVSLIGTIQDITKERELEDQAYHDPLTGVYNRRFLDENIYSLIDNSVIKEQNLCYVIFDIDFFKEINDNYGHDFGDRVLKGVAEYLQRQVRDSDFVCRFGGEEFVVIFNDIEMPSGMERIEKIRHGVGNLQFINQIDDIVKVNLSGGMACTKIHGNDAKQLFELADQALYSAKRSGRNRLKLCDKSSLD
ncbi:MASE3 domain-containing protein [Thiomicrorhabdus sediminis]|uniref:diguanylate cyclase n=1 Tax=Thiomicrorhabdus sediminis TaxID=2580412 RepID=A0A4P9K4X7_9GAMM|nr:MASE3 domain-containing protein [Thiomicrorhabdus sediminis]QCU90064.1 diguanylate cyclase [Thiomicrorhabdus sediminis]